MTNETPTGKNWLEIHDEAVTAVSLISQIEERVRQRRQEHGRVNIQFPTFGYLSPMPEPLQSQNAPNLYHHLRQLNQMDAPPVTAVLVPSPATRVPILGRLWQMVRGQIHNLILFYVNRTNSHNSQVNSHITSTLNELTRLLQEQQQQIEQLQAELDALKKTK